MWSRTGHQWDGKGEMLVPEHNLCRDVMFHTYYSSVIFYTSYSSEIASLPMLKALSSPTIPTVLERTPRLRLIHVNR